jgi:hypothetical protein
MAPWKSAINSVLTGRMATQRSWAITTTSDSSCSSPCVATWARAGGTSDDLPVFNSSLSQSEKPLRVCLPPSKLQA